jgi:hypothetical protein
VASALAAAVFVTRIATISVRRLQRRIFDGPATRRIARVGDKVEVDVSAVARPDRRDDLARRPRERLQQRLRPFPSEVEIRVEAPKTVDGG